MKISKFISKLALGLSAALLAFNINSFHSNASEISSSEVNDAASSIVDSLGTSNTGGTNTITNGVSRVRTGYLIFMLTTEGERFSDYAVALHSTGTGDYAGSKWIVTSRKGNYSASKWSGIAPWGMPWGENGSPTYEPNIRSYFESVDGNGVQKAFDFVEKTFGTEAAIAFGEDKAILVIETIMNLQFSYKSGTESNNGTDTELLSLLAEILRYSDIELMKYALKNNMIDTYKRWINAENTAVKLSISGSVRNKLLIAVKSEYYKRYPNGKISGGRELIDTPFIGTVPNLVKIKSGYNPIPDVFDSYLNKVAPFAEMIEVGKAGQRAGFVPWTGSTSSQISNSDVLNYGLAMMVISAKDEMMQTTYDEKLGDTPGEPARESEKNKYKIIKNYRLKTGETYEDKGVFMIEEVAPKILIEDEPSYKVVGWKISDQTKKPDSTIWENDVPGKISEEGKTPTSVLIKDPSTTLYVLLEKVEKEEIVEDANYVISESSVTRRVHISKPDNALDNITEIGNLMFKWKLPGHLQSCNHSYSSPCEGHGHNNDCLDDCTSSHNCGSNCVTKYDSCSNYNFKDKSLKLSISNSYKDDYPHIVATKEGWRNEVNTGGRVKRFDTVERTNPNEEIYESSNWDLMIVLMRGNDKLTVAEWKNNPETNTDLVDASESGFHVNDKVQGVRKEDTYFEKFNVYFTTEMENADNITKYGAFTKSPITNNLCWNDRSAMLVPLKINDIKVKVETYSGDKNKGTTDTSHNDAKKLVFSNSNFNTSSGRMVKESGTITFNPYIEMKYDSDVKTNSQVYVLGQYQRSIMPNSYAEINWNYKNTENLKLTSSQWNTHASGMKWLNDNNIKDKNSILPGGAKHELIITKDGRQKVEVVSYQVVVKGDFKEQVDRTGGNDGGFTEEKALNSHKDYVNSVINALDNLTVQQFINKDYEKNPFDGKPVYNESDISFLNNGTNGKASSESKYYFKVDDGSVENKAIQGDLDVRKVSSNVTEYIITADTSGNIKLNGNIVLTKDQNEKSLTGLSKLLDEKTYIFTKIVKALERNSGNDKDASWVSDEKWYNEAMDGITIFVQSDILEIGFIDPLERSSILDVKLIPKSETKKNMFSEYYVSGYKMKDYSEAYGEKEVVGMFNGEKVLMHDMDKLFESKRFYITNITTQDLH